MKNNKGFTMAELLGVIVVLSVIVTIASTSVLGVLSNAKEKTAKEMQGSLKDSAINYVISNFHLEKCSEEYSKAVFENNNISNLNLNLACSKKVTVDTLINEGFFEDKKGYCEKSEEVVVYRYTSGEVSEYKAYVSSNACKN